MKAITVKRLSLQFDADEVTTGNAQQQALQAVELVNLVLQRQPFGLGAQLIVTDDLEIQSSKIPD